MGKRREAHSHKPQEQHREKPVAEQAHRTQVPRCLRRRREHEHAEREQEQKRHPAGQRRIAQIFQRRIGHIEQTVHEHRREKDDVEEAPPVSIEVGVARGRNFSPVRRGRRGDGQKPEAKLGDAAQAETGHGDKRVEGRRRRVRECHMAAERRQNHECQNCLQALPSRKNAEHEEHPGSEGHQTEGVTAGAQSTPYQRRIGTH